MQENIAYGQPTPEWVVQDWLESPGHCRGMMNPKFNALGTRYLAADTSNPTNKSFGKLWGQVFVQR